MSKPRKSNSTVGEAARLPKETARHRCLGIANIALDSVVRLVQVYGQVVISKGSVEVSRKWVRLVTHEYFDVGGEIRSV